MENALEQLLAPPRGVVSVKQVRAILDAWRDQKQEWRERPPLPVSLAIYDSLLEGSIEENEFMLEEVTV